MVVKELMTVSYHLVRFFESQSYVALFLRLEQTFNDNYSSLSNDYQPALGMLQNIQRKVINYEAQTRFPFDNHPYLQLVGIADFIGVGALERLKDLINDNPVEAAKLLSSSHNKLRTAEQASRNLRDSLEVLPGFNEAKDLYDVGDRVVVRFVMPEHTHPQLQDTTKEFNALTSALRGFGRLSKDSNAYDLRVLAVSHSSPEQILVAIVIPSAIALNTAVKAILARWKEFEEIRKLRAQTAKLKLENDKHKEKLLKDIDDIELEGTKAATIASQLVAQAKDKDGEDGELQRVIESSVEYIEKLTVNGGVVNIYIPPSQSQNTNGSQIDFIENRKLQSSLGSIQGLLGEDSNSK